MTLTQTNYNGIPCRAGTQDGITYYCAADIAKAFSVATHRFTQTRHGKEVSSRMIKQAGQGGSLLFTEKDMVDFYAWCKERDKGEYKDRVCLQCGKQKTAEQFTRAAIYCNACRPEQADRRVTKWQAIGYGYETWAIITDERRFAFL